MEEVRELISRIIGKKIVVFCFDQTTKEMIFTLKKFGIVVSYIADNNLKYAGMKYKKIEVVHPEEIIRRIDSPIFIILNEKHRIAIRGQLKKLNVKADNIIDIDVCEFLELKEMCKRGWITANKDYFFDTPIKKDFSSFVHYFWNWCKCSCYKKNKTEKCDNKRYYISICGIFKNEFFYLKEWLDFHILVGVDHFYLYNNESTDNFYEILSDYIEKGIVTLYDWPYAHAQMDAYRDCIERCRDESQWIGFIDLDEFVVPNQEESIVPFFRRNINAGSIWIPWKIFGSNGLTKRNINNLVIKEFTRCWDKYSTAGKCFWNTNYDVENLDDFFHHFIWTTSLKGVIPAINVFGQYCMPNFPRGTNQKLPIQINHYVTKSLQEYQKKIKGTDVAFEYNTHTMNAFFWHDNKCNTDDYGMKKWVGELEKL